MIIRETASAYHAREAVSAGFAWDVVSSCPAQAYYNSVFHPDHVAIQARKEAKRHSNELDVGTAAHLAVLESHVFAERCSLVPYSDWRTQDSRNIRDQCVIDGRVPLLAKDYELVTKLRLSIENSDAAEYFFGEGESEVSFTWEDNGIACKARADRIVPGAIVDLKTAISASPQAFQRAMVRYGHHLRAAWYLDGWREGSDPSPHVYEVLKDMRYLYVVVAKTEPHLVSINRLDERALEWGWMLCRKALSEIRRAWETGVWSGYSLEGDKINTVSLPAFAEHQLADMEANDEI
jgi:hypothetical protein